MSFHSVAYNYYELLTFWRPICVAFKNELRCHKLYYHHYYLSYFSAFYNIIIFIILSLWSLLLSYIAIYDSISFYLFSDNVMPNMDGPTACEKIRVSQTKFVHELFHKFTDKKIDRKSTRLNSSHLTASRITHLATTWCPTWTDLQHAKR